MKEVLLFYDGSPTLDLATRHKLIRFLSLPHELVDIDAKDSSRLVEGFPAREEAFLTALRAL